MGAACWIVPFLEDVMIYRIGQRVRIIGTNHPGRHGGAIGREGTIVFPLGGHPLCGAVKYGVCIDGYPCPVPPGDWWAVEPHNLAPLTRPDEAADRFIANLERLGKEPMIQPEPSKQPAFGD